MNSLTPIIHMNGTGKETLAADYKAAHQAVKAALEAVASITVHGRDYYVKTDGLTYENARQGRADMVVQLDQIAQRLQAVRMEIADQ
jgi:hypothetical protein